MAKEDILLKCGYETGFDPERLDSKTRQILDFLSTNNLGNTPHFVKTSLKEIKYRTSAFYANFFASLHSVLSIPKNLPEIYPIMKYKNNEPKDGKTYIEGREYSPFEIPIILKKDKWPFYGAVATKWMENIDLQLFNHWIIIHIDLFKPFSTYSLPCYAHEIMHTQVDTIHGALTNYHNKEVLPIFMEKVIAYDLGLPIFHEIERARLTNLLYSLASLYHNPDNCNYAYYYSTLIAEQLFDLYINCSENEKKIIKAYIQMIIEGKISLEKVLDNLDVTTESDLVINAMTRNLHL